MDALINNNEHALQQWRILFEKNEKNLSPQANKQWEKVKDSGRSLHKDKKWNNVYIGHFLSNSFVTPFDKMINIIKVNKLSLNIDAYRLVFINGLFSSLLSDTNTGLWQVISNKKINRQLLPSPIQSDFFLHLTEALANEITHIFLPADITADKPLYLLHINSGNKNKNTLATSHYYHQIEIANGANGQVIEHFVSMDSHGHFSGARTYTVIGDHSQFDHIKLFFENQNSYHLAHNDIHIGCETKVKSNLFIILGARFNHHQTSVKLNGKGSSLSINSLAFLKQRDISSIFTYLEHNKQCCISRQLHKTIVSDDSQSVFNGFIKVAKHAIKTDGLMLNNNLFLNGNAKIKSEPQLEIYADDVKCSHGVTIGNPDKNQIFYLCTRGIAYENAIKMIIYAFTIEILGKIKNKVIEDVIAKRIINIL
ncbi:Fe-S cluster assembly protein SufD [Blochmannia endosymbiont of Colobopsis nipponica]|uniref:Fe-S cluster assembly protein SufD n=1 Tax=Blochmannia endosymbiont of Colobopsis nipponica TaxID=2681987 RepID=UPI00177D668A|nr:Fe-S cluster assembly protein SufD [Blochmannia endosymbiont of Colobopsis nipponica]QOI11084.1 Fe-S cluster assembly protein SufD [Blochmannia endosymbiont of Colobopsis nipponica]